MAVRPAPIDEGGHCFLDLFALNVVQCHRLVTPRLCHRQLVRRPRTISLFLAGVTPMALASAVLESPKGSMKSCLRVSPWCAVSSRAMVLTQASPWWPASARWAPSGFTYASI